MFEAASEPAGDEAAAEATADEATGAMAADDVAAAEVPAAEVVADAAVFADELHASSIGVAANAAAPRPVALMNCRRVITMLHLFAGSWTEVSS
jgi:hypothetical protein